MLLKILFFWLLVGAAFFGWRRRSDNKSFEVATALPPRNDKRA